MRRFIPIFLLALTLLSTARDARADKRADARRYFTRGMTAIREGDPAKGIELLLRAYQLKPHPNVLYNVANAYRKLGDIEEAINYYERYLDSDPTDGQRVTAALRELRARRRLRKLVDDGMIAISEGRTAEGVALLQRAYDERPHANLLFNIARAQEKEGDLEAAIRNYQAYVASRPKDAAAVTNRLNKLRERLEVQGPKTPTKPRKGGGRVTNVDPRQVAEMVVQMLKESGVGGGRRVGPTGPIGPIGPIGPTEIRPAIVTDTSTTEVSLEAKEEAGYEEVVVTASRREQSPLDAPNAVTIISEDDIRLSGARSIPDLLRRVPGMDVMQMSYADWNVAMRGFNRRIANKLLVLVDGRTAYEDFLGGTLWLGQSYDLSDIARIEVVRGPGSAIYGANAYSGIVNIITKKPSEIGGSSAFISGGNGTALRAGYQYGKRTKNLGIRASVGYEQGNKYEFELDPNRVDYTAAAPQSTNIDRSIQLVRADSNVDYYLPDRLGRVFVGGGLVSGYTEFYGVSALRNQNNDLTSTSLRTGFENELFSVLAFWNSLRTDTTPQFFATGTNDLGSRVEADLLVVEPVFRPTFDFYGEHSVVLGAEYRHKFIEWNYLDEDHADLFFAVYAQDQWRVNDQWTVLASYRLDHHPLLGIIEQPDINLPGSPRLAVVYKPVPGQAIRASLGTAFRAPTQAESYLNLAAASPTAGVGIKLVGQRELLPEDIVTFDVGYLYQGELGEVEVVGYFNRVNNLIVRSPLQLTGVNTPFDPGVGSFVALQSLFQNEERVFVAFGSELSTRLYPVDGVDIGLSYAFQFITDTDGERFTDSPLHKATIWSQYRSEFGLDAGLSLHFVSSQQWIEPEFDPNDPSGFRLDPQPVDASVVLIARVGYRLFDDALELSLAGSNLLDTGSNRHREHPFANLTEARVYGSVTARF